MMALHSLGRAPHRNWELSQFNCFNVNNWKILDSYWKISYNLTDVLRSLDQTAPSLVSSSNYNVWTRNKFRHLFGRDYSILNRGFFSHFMAGSLLVESTTTCHCGITFVFQIEDVLVYWILFHCPDIIRWRRQESFGFRIFRNLSFTCHTSTTAVVTAGFLLLKEEINQPGNDKK